jgi:hypothetical protein
MARSDAPQHCKIKAMKTITFILIAASLFAADTTPKQPVPSPEPQTVKVTVTVAQLMNIKAAFQRFYEQPYSRDAALHISKINSAINAQWDIADAARRGFFDEKHSKPQLNDKGEPNGMRQVRDEYMKDYQKLFSDKVDLSLTPLDLSELGDVKISAADIDTLEPILKDVKK